MYNRELLHESFLLVLQLALLLLKSLRLFLQVLSGVVVVVNREGLITEEEAINLEQNSSAYQAEMLAIKSAAELIQLR